MKYLIFILALTTNAFADEIDDGNKVCLQHKLPYQHNSQPHWKPGWEHCETIVGTYNQRKAAQDAIDETANPDLAATRNLAKKLNGTP